VELEESDEEEEEEWRASGERPRRPPQARWRAERAALQRRVAELEGANAELTQQLRSTEDTLRAALGDATAQRQARAQLELGLSAAGGVGGPGPGPGAGAGAGPEGVVVGLPMLSPGQPPSAVDQHAAALDALPLPLPLRAGAPLRVAIAPQQPVGGGEESIAFTPFAAQYSPRTMDSLWTPKDGRAAAGQLEVSARSAFSPFAPAAEATPQEMMQGAAAELVRFLSASTAAELAPLGPPPAWPGG
jgi:hypothetical protein